MVKLPKSVYYYQLHRKQDEERITAEIMNVKLDNPDYGYRRDPGPEQPPSHSESQKGSTHHESRRPSVDGVHQTDP